MRKLKELFDKIHNKRPLLWAVLAFVIVVLSATAMSIWWNVLLVQNHHIVKEMTRVANQAALDPRQASFPLALFMFVGILCSVVIVLGLLYFFLRLIKTLQLNLAQRQFIAAVTHELRSPVTSLQILLETIRDPSTPKEKRQEFEECMLSDLKRLSQLVDQVLDTAKLENMLTTAQRSPVDLSEFLHKTLDSFNEQFKAFYPKVTLRLLPAQFTVYANRKLLTSAIESVLENAIKYSKEGAPAEIEISVESTNKSILIHIKDEGIGIHKTEQKKIFKRFYRSGDPLTQSKPGTGLGLYFARLALRSQGGNLNLYTHGPGTGCTFTFEVPRFKIKSKSHSNEIQL